MGRFVRNRPTTKWLVLKCQESTGRLLHDHITVTVASCAGTLRATTFLLQAATCGFADGYMALIIAPMTALSAYIYALSRCTHRQCSPCIQSPDKLVRQCVGRVLSPCGQHVRSRNIAERSKSQVLSSVVGVHDSLWCRSAHGL